MQCMCLCKNAVISTGVPSEIGNASATVPKNDQVNSPSVSQGRATGRISTFPRCYYTNEIFREYSHGTYHVLQIPWGCYWNVLKY